MQSILRPILIAAVLAAAAPAQTHTHGSMAGALQPTSVVVWTRASGPANVSVLLNSIPSVSGATETATTPAVGANDFTVRIQVNNLTPGTLYHYATKIIHPTTPSQFTIGSWGTFETPPLPNVADQTSFLVSADVLTLGEYGIFDKMRAENADFYVSLGDMPYTDTSVDQAAYWQRHKDTRNDGSFLNFALRYPIEATWDDHEVLNDWDSSTNATLVGWGKKAFFDYLPLPPAATEIYRSVRWGSGVEVFLLDCRAHRDRNSDPSTPQKTMLGATQKAWLMISLKASTATFKVVCSSIPFRFGKQGYDDWEGFAHERRELFQFIASQGIRNVVLVSGDNHIASAHHHREGLREYVCGPAAQVAFRGFPATPEVRYRAAVRNYLLCRVDPTVTPQTMTMEYHDADGAKLWSEVVKAEAPVQLTVLTDQPHGGFCLKGPYLAKNQGSRTVLKRLDPGTYQVSFDARPESDSHPASATIDTQPGDRIFVAGRFDDVPRRKVLLDLPFEEPLAGHTVLDETGATSGPSSWVVDGGQLEQVTRIAGPVGVVDSDRPGTFLVTGDTAWQDYTVASRLRSRERGRIGVVFRFLDKDNYYRFVMDSERPLRRLEKKVNGVFTVLAEERIPYLPNNYYDVRCVANGQSLKVALDGIVVFSVTDAAFAAGRVGFYVWQNRLSQFEDLVVTAGEDLRPAADRVAADDFEDWKITGWTVQDHGSTGGPSIWLENTGTLLQVSPIGDTVQNDPLANPGTVCLSDATIPDDMQFSISATNFKEQGFGVVFRYTDPKNHYRFSWSEDGRWRRLEKVVAGTWSLLWQDNQGFNLDQWYRIRVLAIGPRLRLFLDEEPLADVTDSAHGKGTVGLYSWKSPGVLFDNFLVQRPPDVAPSLIAITRNRVTTLHGLAPGSANLVYGLGLALRKTPPIPLSWLNPADPRIIDIAPDFLFLESLVPGPLWQNLFGKLDAQGNATARILWPPLPSLVGLRFYVAGWTDDVTRGPVKDVFPTVEVLFPE